MLKADLLIVGAIARGDLAHVHRTFVSALLDGEGVAARALPPSTLAAVRYALQLSGKQSQLPLPQRGWSHWQRLYWAWANGGAADTTLAGVIQTMIPETDGDALVLSGLVASPASGASQAPLVGAIRRLARMASDGDSTSAVFLEELLTRARTGVSEEAFSRWLDTVAAEGLEELAAKLRRRDG